MEMRTNQEIKCKEVRLIGQEGTQMGIVPTFTALAKAEEEGLDLVEVSPESEPPVCKLMDYGKFKFERKKKDKERKRNTKVVQTKTIKLRPKISGGDLNTKINQISKFLLEGNKVRVIVQFKGREISHKEIGKDLLDKIHDSMTAHCTLEVSPKMEGRAMTMVLAPGSE